MKKITHFVIDGTFHSTQDTDISYDWCIEGAEYKFINGNQYIVSNLEVIICGTVRVKVANLTQVN